MQRFLFEVATVDVKDQAEGEQVEDIWKENLSKCACNSISVVYLEENQCIDSPCDVRYVEEPQDKKEGFSLLVEDVGVARHLLLLCQEAL